MPITSRSKKGQRAIDSRMALGALLIKPAYKAMSDEDITREIAMNPHLQYFLRLHEYRYECPFDPSMMTRFRQRITPEMLSWVNDQTVGRKTEDEKYDDDGDSDSNSHDDENKESEGTATEENEGTLILDATCAPQNIRFPTDASLLNLPQNGIQRTPQSLCFPFCKLLLLTVMIPIWKVFLVYIMVLIIHKAYLKTNAQIPLQADGSPVPVIRFKLN